MNFRRPITIGILAIIFVIVLGLFFLPSVFVKRPKTQVAGVKVEREKKAEEEAEAEAEEEESKPEETVQEPPQETVVQPSTAGRRTRRVSSPAPISLPDTVAPAIDCITKNAEAKRDETTGLFVDKLIEAIVNDDIGVSKVLLYYKKASEQDFNSYKDMTYNGNKNVYEGVIEGSFIKESYDTPTSINYYIEAEDASGNKAKDPKEDASPNTYEIVPEGVVVIRP